MGPTIDGARERREALRARLNANAPRGYSPWVHLATPSLVGIGASVACALLLRAPTFGELLLLPGALLLLNVVEWHIHRDLLHRRSRWLAPLYDQHTPEHHLLFSTDEMYIRGAHELRLVLMPSFAIVLIALVALPIPLLLSLLGARNVGLILMASIMGYVVLYEWTHLLHHLPPTSRVGRSRLAARMRRHHAVHHDPALMSRYNLNVTFPLWDLVRGSLHRGARAARAKGSDGFGAVRHRPSGNHLARRGGG